MTVQELINKLNKVKDKNSLIRLEDLEFNVRFDISDIEVNETTGRVILVTEMGIQE